MTPANDAAAAISSGQPPFIPYPPIKRHGVVGDRRTAALVAADGAVDWQCLPEYEDTPIFGALLDAERGGYWRMGPMAPSLGRQRYVENTAVLITSWSSSAYELELTDAMLWTDDPNDRRRVMVRRLRCQRGDSHALMEIRPRAAFSAVTSLYTTPGGFQVRIGGLFIGLWCSRPLQVTPAGGVAHFNLREGEEVWATLVLEDGAVDWTEERARAATEETTKRWQDWVHKLDYKGPEAERVIRSAITIHLLSYVPAGSVVAAVSNSLPERIGGGRNYDYRYSWVRDASLALGTMSLLGGAQKADHYEGRYLDWLCTLGSKTRSPLQVVYGLNGVLQLDEREASDVAGYRESQPYRTGNRAAKQRQLGSLGYLADSMLIYLQKGGDWRKEYWSLLCRSCSYTIDNWQKPDHGIWELPEQAHYVSSKVMSWVVLDRAVAIAGLTGVAEEPAWRETMEQIRADVMEKGWSENLGAFRQRYDVDTLDAGTLLIPIMGFLPADDPHVLSTLENISTTLAIGDMVYRFDARSTPGCEALPIGEFEGSFVPCTFWLASALAMAGRVVDAERILSTMETAMPETGLLAEEIDPRDDSYLGNLPLLFSHAEYLRAVLEIDKARQRQNVKAEQGKR